MIQYQDRTIENESFTLDSKTEVYYFGHNLVLKSCSLLIKVPEKALVLSRVRLIDCTLVGKIELKGFQWWSASFEGCRFKGRLRSCDFGNWPDIGPFGDIKNCDFSEARLHWCRFTRCDASTLRFPRWPCFTILDPVRRADELRSIRWPGQAGLLVDVVSNGRIDTAATTMDATILCKKYNTTAEELKAALQGLSGIIC